MGEHLESRMRRNLCKAVKRNICHDKHLKRSNNPIPDILPPNNPIPVIFRWLLQLQKVRNIRTRCSVTQPPILTILKMTDLRVHHWLRDHSNNMWRFGGAQWLLFLKNTKQLNTKSKSLENSINSIAHRKFIQSCKKMKKKYFFDIGNFIVVKV